MALPSPLTPMGGSASECGKRRDHRRSLPLWQLLLPPSPPKHRRRQGSDKIIGLW